MKHLYRRARFLFFSLTFILSIASVPGVYAADAAETECEVYYVCGFDCCDSPRAHTLLLLSDRLNDKVPEINFCGDALAEIEENACTRCNSTLSETNSYNLRYYYTCFVHEYCTIVTIYRVTDTNCANCGYLFGSWMYVSEEYHMH